MEGLVVAPAECPGLGVGIVGLAGDAGGDGDGGAVVAGVGYREVKKSGFSGQGGLMDF